MVKPTVLQSILGRPSQSYHFPYEKDYHSSKQRLSLIAMQESNKPLPEPTPNDDNHDSSSDSDSDDDVFYTPVSSPRNSLVGAVVSAPHLPLPSSSTTSLDSTLATFSVDDRHSLFSAPTRSESTHITIPISSDTGHGTTAKESWAKDVRWLVPPQPSTSHSTKTHTKSRSESSSSQQQRTPTARRRRSRSLTSRSSSSYKTVETSTPYTETLAAQQLPSTGTAGYTTLVLPRAPPPASATLIRTVPETTNKVDLTRTGMAHTTMASVELVGGLSTQPTSWMTKWRRKKPQGEVVLGFTHHLSPPHQVPPQSVLIQVWAVGLDGMDGILCRAATVGYIPGRSIVGRAVEVGWQVPEDVVRRGEWVVALTEMKTAGGLTEFVVVDRHRLCRVPHPNMSTPHVYGDGLEQVYEEEEEEAAAVESEGPSVESAHDGRYPTPRRVGSRSKRPTKPPVSRSASKSVVRPREFGLGLEELALLGVCGVPAYRAIRTLVYNHDSTRRKRALVLNGHVGVGALAVQMLCRQGWKVCLHAHLVKEDDGDEEAVIRAYAQTWGADEVIFGDAQETLELCTRQKDVFEAVLDTVGGQGIREAAYRLLAHAHRGSFTTVVGDHPDRVIPTAADHFRAGRRGRGKIAYAWTSVAQEVDWEGEDIAQTLHRVLNEGVRPVVAGHAIMGLDRVESDRLFSLLRTGQTPIVKVAV